VNIKGIGVQKLQIIKVIVAIAWNNILELHETAIIRVVYGESE